MLYSVETLTLFRWQKIWVNTYFLYVHICTYIRTKYFFFVSRSLIFILSSTGTGGSIKSLVHFFLVIYPRFGPKWIAETPINWSNSNPECLSQRSKDLVKSTVFHNTISEGGVLPIIPFNRFSKLEKLIKATEFAFRFIHRARQLNASDPGHNARIHLFKIMQQRTFQKEIAYLKDPSDTPPDLVKNFNRFLDDEGILSVSL